MKCEMEINWLINDTCNFDCVYCYPGSKKNEFAGERDIQKIASGFKRTGLKLMIYISGGEPFLFPHFVDLCKELTKDHIISVNSNISHSDVFKFIKEINPERVRCFHCSLHIEERERRKSVKDFIEKYNLLKRNGFYTYASYVLYPPVIRRFKKDYAFFESEGIILRPKIFRGIYNKFNKITGLPVFKNIEPWFQRRYPNEYSKDEKKTILSYIRQSQVDGKFHISHEEDKWKGRLSDTYLDASFIDGLPSFTGKYCMAGKSFVRMSSRGEVYRCCDDATNLGNLFNGEIRFFEKPKRCRASLCSCPYIGYRHVLQNDDEYKNEERVLLSTTLNSG